MIGQDTHLPHTLVPLVLAVSLVRSRLSPRAAAVSPDSNSLATFIASAVPVFEYFDDPNWLPRLLIATWQDGVFTDGGAELRFMDGRRSTRLLAVQADDVECVIGMLNDPENRLRIRSKVLTAAAARLRRSSTIARREAAGLRADAREARSRCMRSRTLASRMKIEATGNLVRASEKAAPRAVPGRAQAGEPLSGG
jgi:hypothetical protein